MAQKKALQKSSRVQQAEERLRTAVSRLEAIIQGASMSDKISNKRVVALEADLQGLKLQNTKLRKINHKVGGSLDKVIDDLKSVLKE